MTAGSSSKPASHSIVQKIQVQLTLRSSTLGPDVMFLPLLPGCGVCASVTMFRCSCLCYYVAVFLSLLPGCHVLASVTMLQCFFCLCYLASLRLAASHQFCPKHALCTASHNLPNTKPYPCQPHIHEETLARRMN